MKDGPNYKVTWRCAAAIMNAGTFVPKNSRPQGWKFHRVEFHRVELSFPGTFVPGNFLSQGRKFQHWLIISSAANFLQSSSWYFLLDQKFSPIWQGSKVQGKESSGEWKFQGTKVPPYGTFVPGDESSATAIIAIYCGPCRLHRPPK